MEIIGGHTPPIAAANRLILLVVISNLQIFLPRVMQQMPKKRDKPACSGSHAI
jgi:hypothetical protein